LEAEIGNHRMDDLIINSKEISSQVKSDQILINALPSEPNTSSHPRRLGWIGVTALAMGGVIKVFF
jgi:hypothetical protein